MRFWKIPEMHKGKGALCNHEKALIKKGTKLKSMKVGKLKFKQFLLLHLSKSKICKQAMKKFECKGQETI